MYYLAFPKDRRSLKFAVIWVYLVGVAQTILSITDSGIAFDNLQGNSCDTDRMVGGVTHFWLTVIAFSAPGEDVQAQPK